MSVEVVQWLVPRTSSANREVGGSSLTVSTNDPLGPFERCRHSAKGESFLEPMQPSGSLS